MYLCPIWRSLLLWSATIVLIYAPTYFAFHYALLIEITALGAKEVEWRCGGGL